MKRRGATAAAVALMIGMPLAALWLAPRALADDTPGANLAGVDATATASGVTVAPLTPGLVGAGDVSKGNLVEADIPYATSSTSTGPSSSGVASPAYPGDSASQAGNLFNTFTPLPAPLENALNDPVLARSDYPAQVSVGTSGSYTPPTGTTGGLLSASSESKPSGTTSDAALSLSTLPASLVQIGSATAHTATSLSASSVKSTAHTDIGRISLLGGAVVIAGLSSDATASSDGISGKQSNDLMIGQVTVAGQTVSIGPGGIQAGSGAQGGLLVPAVNQVLGGLEQAGISVRTLAPTTHIDGTSAQVTSGALEISFLDKHIPNPNGTLPVSAAGLDMQLGGASAFADATSLPPFDSSSLPDQSQGALTSPGSGAAAVSGTGGFPVSGGGAQVALAVPSQPSVTGGAPAGEPPSLSPSQGSPSGTRALPATAAPASLLGAPVRVVWVVIAFLLSLVAAGPLLGYANWQLLRGRKS